MLPNIIEHSRVIGSYTVKLIDIDKSRNGQLPESMPDNLRLCLNTLLVGDNRISTAPSMTRNERSTSERKSTCPGVSTKLTEMSFQLNVVAAARTDMPRSRSTSSQSGPGRPPIHMAELRQYVRFHIIDAQSLSSCQHRHVRICQHYAVALYSHESTS